LKKQSGAGRYLMPFISDKDLFGGVMYARRLIREGNPPGLAIVKAASYWRVDKSDVAHYVGIVANNVKQRQSIKAYQR